MESDEDSVMKDEINIESDCLTSGPDREVCNICWKPFESELKIRCAECSNMALCLQCFSLGLVTKTHHRSHPYHVDRRHIPLDPGVTWTPYEDSDLLTALIECGYGNFEDIGKRFLHRTTEEVRIRINELLGLDKAPLLACLQLNDKPIVPYSAELLKEEPPRYPYRSCYAKGTAGYCAPRGEFEVEPDNYAENMLEELGSDSDDEEEEEEITLDEEDKEINKALTCSIVQCYIAKLAERQRIKNIVREHGLILKKSFFVNTNLIDPKSFVFSQLLSHDDFTSLAVGLSMERNLRKRFFELRRYRSFGIKKLRSCSMFNKLDEIRKRNKIEHYNVLKSAVKPSVQLKKPSQPIDITHCNGYHDLTEKEKILCANVRILPEVYLKFKKSMIEINLVEGGVRLLVARQLLKVDVNKTRKVYDFLRDEEIITAK